MTQSLTMTDHEAVKFDICRAARLLYRQGLSVANAGRLSVATGPGEMLVNHFGPSFATLRPENVRVDFDGRVLDGQAYVNDTIRLHGIILARLRSTDPDLFEGREN